MSNQTLERLLEQRKQIEHRIQQTKNRVASEEKAKDARRKFLAGAYLVMVERRDLPRLGKRMFQAGVLEPRDYPLFGLSPSDIEASENLLRLPEK